MGERIPHETPGDDTVRHINFAKDEPTDTPLIDFTKAAEAAPAPVAVPEEAEPASPVVPEAATTAPVGKKSSSKSLAMVVTMAAAFGVIFVSNDSDKSASEAQPCTREYPDFRSFTVSGVQLGDLEGKHGVDARAKTLHDITSHFGTQKKEDKIATPSLTEWSVLVHSKGTANDPADVESALTSTLQRDLGVEEDAITVVEAPAVDPKKTQVAVGTLAVWQQMSQRVDCPSQ